MKKLHAGGRPKEAKQVVVLRLTVEQLQGHLEDPVVMDQVKAANKTAPVDYRECVHGMKVSRRARPKRLSCSLCEKRVESGKSLLWRSA